MVESKGEVFTDKVIFRFIGAFLLSTIFVGITCFPGKLGKDLLDYLSYVLPCMAGIVAGGAIISPQRRGERSLYILAVVILVLGFVCYLGSHANPALKILMLIGFLSAVAVVSLIVIAVKKDYTGNSEGLWMTILIFLLAIGVFSEFYIVVKHKKVFVDDKPSFCFDSSICSADKAAKKSDDCKSNQRVN